MGVFNNAMSLVAHRAIPRAKTGFAGWLLACLHRGAIQSPRLKLIERMNLAPRQTLSLIEADGERLLVAISPEGAPAFYPLRGAAGRRPGRAKKDSERKIA